MWFLGISMGTSWKTFFSNTGAPEDTRSSPQPDVSQQRAVGSTYRHVPSDEAGKRKLGSLSSAPPAKHRSQFWEQRFQDHLAMTPDLQTMCQCQDWDGKFTGQIQFKLPRVGALCGSILQHCSEVIERTCHAEYPLIFKLGFTHNPYWRWGNCKYGYAFAREKWSNMIVLYVSNECHSVSMLEAALIDKYKGTLSLTIYVFHLLQLSYSPHGNN